MIFKKYLIFSLLMLSMLALPLAQADTTKPRNTATQTVPVKTVDINTADEKTLAKMLKGVGKAKAKAIVLYRKKNGLFKTPADLMKVKGIGKKILAQNKDKIRVSAGTKKR